MDRAKKIVKEIDDYLSSLDSKERENFLKSMGFKFKEDTTFPTVPITASAKKELPEFIHVFGYINMHSDISNHIELYEKWFSKNYLVCFSFSTIEGEEVVCLNFGDDLVWLSCAVESFKAFT